VSSATDHMPFGNAMKVRPISLVLTVFLAMIAASMSLGHLHNFQNADSLVPVLVSIQHWTPFYWGQDRFGMLVPLLAMPVRNPLGNLLLQGWLMSLAALMAPFVVTRYLGVQECFIVGALANILFLLVAPTAVQFDWLVAQPYALSITLGFSSLLLIEGAPNVLSWVFAIGLMLLANWVDAGIFVILCPAVVVTGRSRTCSLGLTIAGAAAGIAVPRILPLPHTTTAFTPVTEWPSGWVRLLRNTLAVTIESGSGSLLAIGTALGAIAVWILVRNHRLINPALVAIAVGLANWMIVGASEWVRLNLYNPRYVYPSLMMFGIAAAVVLNVPWHRHPKAMTIAACIVLVVTSIVRYGRPSLTRLERSLDVRFGRITPAVLDAHANVIAGEYWAVWPEVFHANLVKYYRTGQNSLFGLTSRSEVTDKLWIYKPEPSVIAAAPGDPMVSTFADRVDLILIPVQRGPVIVLFVGIRKGSSASSHDNVRVGLPRK
jgi:hypothetical protein